MSFISIFIISRAQWILPMWYNRNVQQGGVSTTHLLLRGSILTKSSITSKSFKRSYFFLKTKVAWWSRIFTIIDTEEARSEGDSGAGIYGDASSWPNEQIASPETNCYKEQNLISIKHLYIKNNPAVPSGRLHSTREGMWLERRCLFWILPAVEDFLKLCFQLERFFQLDLVRRKTS